MITYSTDSQVLECLPSVCDASFLKVSQIDPCMFENLQAAAEKLRNELLSSQRYWWSVSRQSKIMILIAGKAIYDMQLSVQSSLLDMLTIGTEDHLCGTDCSLACQLANYRLWSAPLVLSIHLQYSNALGLFTLQIMSFVHVMDRTATFVIS